MSNAGRRSLFTTPPPPRLPGLAPAGPREQKTMWYSPPPHPRRGFSVYGAAYAAAINEADPTLNIETRNTAQAEKHSRPGGRKIRSGIDPG